MSADLSENITLNASFSNIQVIYFLLKQVTIATEYKKTHKDCYGMASSPYRIENDNRQGN